MHFNALINIGKLYTGSDSVLRDCSLLIENDKIKEISSDSSNTFNLSNDQITDINNNIITPGFIDGHTHPVFNGSRSFELDFKLQGLSYSEIAERGGGINFTTSQTRKASRDVLKSNLMAFCQRALEHGTTSVEVKTGYHLEPEGELLALDIINEVQNLQPVTLVPTFLGAHLVPSEYKSRPDDYVQLMNDIMPRVKNQGIAKFTDVFCDRGAFTVDQTMSMIDQSIKNGLPVRLHGEELIRTGIAKESAQKYGGKWIKSVDHLLKATEEDFQVMAKNKVTATFMPVGPIVLFDHHWPSYDVLRKINGLSIGLGSDFNPNSWFYSMQGVQSLATYFMKIPPAKALSFATVNNAQSLQLRNMGEVKNGFQADLVEFKVSDISELSYQIGANNVNRVFKKGIQVHPKP